MKKSKEALDEVKRAGWVLIHLSVANLVFIAFVIALIIKFI